jgi:hypothetical protein
MERAFLGTKKVLREAKKLKLPEFDKRFTLKTDASKAGLGAVLLQEKEEGNWVPTSSMGIEEAIGDRNPLRDHRKRNARGDMGNQEV